MYTSATHLLQVVHICVYAYICVWMHMYMDAYVRLWYCLTRWGVVVEIFCLYIDMRVHVCVCVCACMRVYVHVHMYVYAYMCVCVYVCIYLYVHARVGVHMHSCRRIFLFALSNPSTTCVFITGVFWTPACVGEGNLEVRGFPACSWLALVAGVGGYVLAGVEIGVLSCIFLYFCGC